MDAILGAVVTLAPFLHDIATIAKLVLPALARVDAVRKDGKTEWSGSVGLHWRVKKTRTVSTKPKPRRRR
jgi:hypothetical protein